MGFFRFALGQCAFIDSFNSETRVVLPEQKSGFVCSLQQEDNVRMYQGQNVSSRNTRFGYVFRNIRLPFCCFIYLYSFPLILQAWCWKSATLQKEESSKKQISSICFARLFSSRILTRIKQKQGRIKVLWRFKVLYIFILF